jgi:acyl dehydratase
MALNKACAGKEYPAAVTEVTLEATRNYARACNDLNPRYFEAGAPGGIVAPPMFAVVATWMPVISAMTDPELHADLIRLLHSAQDMEFMAPMRPGDTITAAARIGSIECGSNGETMVLQIEAHNQHGEAVNRTAFTVFIRGHREPGAAGETKSAVAEGGAARGEPMLVVAQTIDRDQTTRYAEASGDHNPIHVDENVARMAGLPGIIVHGLCTMAFTSKVMIDHLCGGEPARLKRLAVRFSRPVFPGDTITTKMWGEGNRNGRQVYAFETYNPEGLAVIRDGIAETAT